MGLIFAVEIYISLNSGLIKFAPSYYVEFGTHISPILRFNFVTWVLKLKLVFVDLRESMTFLSFYNMAKLKVPSVCLEHPERLTVYTGDHMSYWCNFCIYCHLVISAWRKHVGRERKSIMCKVLPTLVSLLYSVTMRAKRLAMRRQKTRDSVMLSSSLPLEYLSIPGSCRTQNGNSACT